MSTSQHTHSKRGFTIIELLVVVSIIALLIGILLPAIGRAREQAKLSQSQSNLRQLAIAHQTYGAEYGDRQFTLLPDSTASYGNDAASAIDNYIAANGPMSSAPGLPAHVELGMDENGATFLLGTTPVNILRDPYFHGSTLGAYRVINTRNFNQYLGGKWLDPVFYAPKDTVTLEEIQPMMDGPGEWTATGLTTNFGYASYITSPAAMYNPQAFSRDGYIDPWSMNAGAKSPSFSDARFPDLKTHMIEHYWLQNTVIDCNPNFANCQPYFFNHATRSQPVTLFYDGRIAATSATGATNDDIQNSNSAGYELWRRDTPSGADGYFIPQGYDFAATSYHMFTTDGIRGRDILQ